MEQINKAELLGNVGLVFPAKNSEQHFIRFTLATNLPYYADDGSSITETTWHTISARDASGMPDFNKILKGVCLHVWGRIRNSKYTANDGTDKYSSDIVANRIEIVE